MKRLVGRGLPTLALLAASFICGSAADAGRLPDPFEPGDFHFNGEYSDDKVVLGKLLFFDKILSGNQNMSCGTCHSALRYGHDGVALAIGEGAAGIGVTRDLGTGADAVPGRIPRSTPALFNLGHKSLAAAFHDGRVEVDASEPSGYATPAGAAFPPFVDTVMAAQAFFPAFSDIEMAGQPGENDQADLAADGDFAGLWAFVAAKVAAIPEYVELFKKVYHPGLEPNVPVTEAGHITYVHIANAIFAWEAQTFRSENSPFDRYLARDRRAISPNARKGMKLFFRNGCDECHSGPLLSDNAYHSLALPQVGPGTGDGDGGHEDFGRERVTGDPSDRYRFRTPPLRNVTLTAPYGHDGAFADLESMVRHHLDTAVSLGAYDRDQLELFPRADLDALDFIAMDDAAVVAAISSSTDLAPLARPMDDEDIGYLLDFLEQGLTDPKMLGLTGIMPQTVPSALPVYD